MLSVSHYARRAANCAAFILCALALALSVVCEASEPLAVSAKSGILMDAATGKVLYTKAARKRAPMASTTKIMTAMVVVGNSRPTDKVVVSESALQTKYASLWVEAGQTMRMEDILKAMLVNSSNDACVAASEAIFGSEQAMVAKMNERARELGARDTHFVNTHGLHDPDHYSTAYDLVIIAREALKNPAIRKLVATKKVVIAWPGKPWGRVLQNRNKLLWLLPGADGVKTGFVKESGKCLVASATRGGWRVLAVVLDSEDCWKDAASLLEHGFREYRRVRAARAGQVIHRARVRGGRKRDVALAAVRPVLAVVRREDAKRCRLRFNLSEPLRAPLKKGERVGMARLYLGKKELASGPLVVKTDVALSWPLTIWLWFKRAAAALAALFVLALGVRRSVIALRGIRRRGRPSPPSNNGRRREG